MLKNEICGEIKNEQAKLPQYNKIKDDCDDELGHQQDNRYCHTFIR